MHKTIISTAFIVLAMTMASMVFGADAQPSPLVEPKAVCERMLGHVAKDKFSDALAIFRATGLKPMEDREWNRFVSATELQLRTAKDNFGEPLGWELVREDRVNETLRRYVYLLKYDSGVSCWEFVFYRPRNAWKLYAWTFGERLNSLWPSPNTGPPRSPAVRDQLR